MNTTPCPLCSHLEPTGTFQTHITDKVPLKSFRVQHEKEGRTIVYGEYDTIEAARAGACNLTAQILTREKTTPA